MRLHRLGRDFPKLYDRVELLRAARLRSAPLRVEDYELIDLWDAVQAGKTLSAQADPFTWKAAANTDVAES